MDLNQLFSNGSRLPLASESGASMPPNHQHQLLIRQQPKHSRMCGYGDKVDRRPIDPPPIIQLISPGSLSTSSSSSRSGLESLNPYYFMYASLCTASTHEEIHILEDGRTRSSTGSVVSSLYRLRDLDNSESAFFVFPDLSIRMEGEYCLKFSLFQLIGNRVCYCSCVFSEAFHVYAAKKFPGMEESTALSKAFADQGLKIRIRKELRPRKRKVPDDENSVAE
eukprot:Partr_v1_DN24536_c0_g1_i4_m19613 putative Velvet factor